MRGEKLICGTAVALAAVLSFGAPAASGAAPLAAVVAAPADLRAEAARAIARDDAARDDAYMRKAAVAALGSRPGAVVVLDPRDGRVLTIVNQEWAVRRAFHPASTMKMLTALTALRDGKLDPDERLPAPDRGGDMDLARALATSSSDWFETVGRRSTPARFLELARAFGFGEPTGIDLPGEAAGRLPAEVEFERGMVFGAAEALEATPLQLALYTAAIANGGTLLAPHYGDTGRAARREVGLGGDVLRAVVPGMIETVRAGTGRNARDAGVPLAAKTGTNLNETGFFVSYAPVDDPRVVVVTMLRGEKANGFEAARVAGALYKKIKGRL
jgi:cell division protein FtsI/penicillin-binding protein 2